MILCHEKHPFKNGLHLLAVTVTAVAVKVVTFSVFYHLSIIQVFFFIPASEFVFDVFGVFFLLWWVYESF